MEKARKAEFMPHLRVDILWLAPTFLVLKANNFGKGPALNIKAVITFLPSKETKKWEQTVMSSGEFLRVMFPDGSIEKVHEKSEEVVVEGEYEDLFRQHFPLSEKLNVKEFIEQTHQLQPLQERDLARIAEGIKDELTKIHRELSQRKN